LKNLQATHILLNREAKRVRRAFSNNSGNFIPENQPDLKLVNTANQSVPEGIYIIDPNGNLVFRYAIVTNPKDILQDLKRLLKVSQIG
jgi:cytochrome oxidase Cu insertion factor (SCO1/SenC/PrrC family)